MSGMVAPACASAGKDALATQSAKINEFDLYNLMRSTPESVLLEQRYSYEQIEVFTNINFEEMVYQRAVLSDTELESIGYSENESSILRNYNGAYADTRALAGTLTAEIDNLGSNGSGIIVRYEWSWNHAPFVTATDSMGMRWQAFDNDSVPIDVYASSSVANVTYTYPNGQQRTERYFPGDKNFSDELNFNALSCYFLVREGTTNFSGYALSGLLQTFIQKDSNVKRDIYYLKICGVYGHSLINIGAPSVSFSPDSIGISFTGGINVENIGIKKYWLYMDGRKLKIDA